MASNRLVLAATLAAAAFGALAAGVVVTLQSSPVPVPENAPESTTPRALPEPVRRERARRQPRQRAPRGRQRVRERVFSSDDDAAGPIQDGGPSLSELLSSGDERIRLETALQLMRRGTDALPQVRALRPRTAEGRALAQGMAVALHKLKLIERGEGYGLLAHSERMRLWLETYESVIPSEMLAQERRECWQAIVDINRTLAAKGRLRLSSGEAALAELELARAELELNEMKASDYRALVSEKSGVVEEWIASMRGRRSVSPAQLRRHEEHWAELRE